MGVGAFDNPDKEVDRIVARLSDIYPEASEQKRLPTKAFRAGIRRRSSRTANIIRMLRIVALAQNIACGTKNGAPTLRADDKESSNRRTCSPTGSACADDDKRILAGATPRRGVFSRLRSLIPVVRGIVPDGQERGRA